MAETPASLVELATDVRVAVGDLGQNLHPESARELRGMVRIMNSYYSNLIEGHNTRPKDIEAVLEGRADEVADQPLAEEAAAHVRVQDWIDDTPIEDLPEPTSRAAGVSHGGPGRA